MADLSCDDGQIRFVRGDSGSGVHWRRGSHIGVRRTLPHTGSYQGSPDTRQFAFHEAALQPEAGARPRILARAHRKWRQGGVALSEMLNPTSFDPPPDAISRSRTTHSKIPRSSI